MSLTVAAAMGIIALLVPGFGRTQERVLVTALVVGLFSLPALACSIVLGRKRLVPLMWIGIASTLLALLLWLTLVWIEDPWQRRSDIDWEEILGKPGTLFSVIAGLSMHAGLLTLLRLERWPHRMVRGATIAVATVLGATIVSCVWGEIYRDWMGRTLGVLSILGAFGTVVTPVLALIELLQRRSDRETIPSRVKVELFCPRCRLQQVVPAGVGKCANCGLRIEIEVDEPRCECGYLLYQLEGDACPECGKKLIA